MNKNLVEKLTFVSLEHLGQGSIEKKLAEVDKEMEKLVVGMLKLVDDKVRGKNRNG